MTVRHRVAVYGTVDKRIEVEHGATKGATVGVNLFNQDGTLVGVGDIALSTTVIQQIVNQINGGDTIIGGGSGPSVTDELPEGNTNLYYTDARAYDAIGFMWDHTYHIGASVTREGDQMYLEVYQQGTTVKYQPAHGILEGEPIHLNGTVWERATASDPTKTADAICWYVTDPDTIRPIFSGPAYASLVEWDAITGDTGGLVPGAYYYLSTVVGKLTRTKPTTGISQCVGVATTISELWVHIHEAESVVAGGGGVDSAVLTITQAAHGFAVGTPIHLNGAAWQAAAMYDPTKTCDAMVDSVTDANTFKARLGGPLTLTIAQWDARIGTGGATGIGLVPGEYYWLYEFTAGRISTTQPTYGLQQCLGVAMNATTLLIRIGEVIPTGQTGAGSGLDSDMLDGEHGGYYLDLANATGVLPVASLPATVTSGVVSPAPTLVAVTNVGAGSCYGFQWMRVGNMVTCCGALAVGPAVADLDVVLGIPLPIPSDLGTNTQGGGTACSPGNYGAGLPSIVAAIVMDPTNNRAEMRFRINETVVRNWWFHFTYLVV